MWINNKVLSYSTGNYIHHPVISHNGKKYERKYTCITESFCCRPEINTGLQINYTSIKCFFKKGKCVWQTQQIFFQQIFQANIPNKYSFL